MAHLADLNVLEFSQTVRPLGAIEQMFWLLDQHHPIHFAMVAHVSGATQVGDWRNALDRLQQRTSADVGLRAGRGGRHSAFRADDGAAHPDAHRL